MAGSTWDNLIIDSAAVPTPLDEHRFQRWMAGQRVFVSSAMDAEMTPYRVAAKDYLQAFGSQVAVMWETLSPQDTGPKAAYLTGVDRASLMLLMLGSSYGVSDASGFSPTQQEAERAGERHISRLLFTLPIPSSSRDGKLNRWLQELYQTISGNSVASTTDMVASLDARFREFAARSERLWLKLGDCIFTGRVQPEVDQQGRRRFTVTARAFDHRLRQALMELNDPYSRRQGELRLTWPFESHVVQVVSIKQMQEFVGEAEVEIVCQSPQSSHSTGGPRSSIMRLNNVTPEEQVREWLGHVLLGHARTERASSLSTMVKYDRPTLPQVLAKTGMLGWQAEGIARLYAIEELASNCGGQFLNFQLGTATATGIAMNCSFVLQSNNQASPVTVTGIIPLK